jgi:hypothetical protein
VIPRTPILIARDSSSITLKLPPFQPVLSEQALTQDPNKDIIISMALYGKVSEAGVGVSETAFHLDNTGVRQKVGSRITVRNLV